MRDEREYTAVDLAVVVPTKDRPDSLRALLESLAGQTAKPSLVIIVDGGESVEAVVQNFADRLPVRYASCNPPGQIRQRIRGLAMLPDDVRLVACLDDKIVLEPDALEQMIACWNRVEPQTAGIGFNIINMPPSRPSGIYRLFGVSAEHPGSVSWTGHNALFLNITEDIRIQWLGGGYTVWRKDILDAHPQREIRTRWAAGEDVRFSYPIGRRFPLYACSSARVRNVTIMDQVAQGDVTEYRAMVMAKHGLYFARTQKGISFVAALWMMAGLICIDSYFGWKYGNLAQRASARGRARGVAFFFKKLFSTDGISTVLDD